MPTNAEIANRWVDVVRGRAVPDYTASFGETVTVGHCYRTETVEIPGMLLGDNMQQDHDRFSGIMSDYRNDIQRVLVDDSGFAVANRITGTLADGQKIDYSCCTVVTVENGLITGVDGYADKQAHLPFLQAVMKYRSEQAESLTAPDEIARAQAVERSATRFESEITTTE